MFVVNMMGCSFEDHKIEAFQNVLESKLKPTENEDKKVIGERLFRTLMNEFTYTSNSLNVYIYKLDEIVLEFNKTVDSTT